MKGQWRVASCGAVACLLAMTPLALADIVDQFAEGPEAGTLGVGVGTTGQSFGAGQTFTSGVTAQLARVEVYLTVFRDPTLPIVLEVREQSDGLPTGAVIGSASQVLPPNIAGSWVSFDFLSQNIHLTAGQSLSIVLTSAQNYFSTFLGYDAVITGNVYANGEGFSYESSQLGWERLVNFDLKFRTFIVPAPGAAALLGLAGLSAVRRVRKQ